MPNNYSWDPDGSSSPTLCYVCQEIQTTYYGQQYETDVLRAGNIDIFCLTGFIQYFQLFHSTILTINPLNIIQDKFLHSEYLFQ